MDGEQQRKRILVTVAHYFDAQGDRYYGSTGPNFQRRAQGLASTIAGFQQVFGNTQTKLLNRKRHVFTEVNDAMRYDVDVVVCTAGDRHLLGELALSDTWFTAHSTDVDGLMLPFECHAVLRDRFGDYDYYCYVEDDLVVSDPLFFVKLKWFSDTAGDRALLLPNRYELSTTEPVAKMYIDGHLSRQFAAQWQDFADRPFLTGSVMGLKVRFERPNNPHAGCFFLNAAQMSTWLNAPHFLDRDTAFAGPLESAATLGIMKTFDIYKPAPASAGFLEIHHLNNRYLGNWLNK